MKRIGIIVAFLLLVAIGFIWYESRMTARKVATSSVKPTMVIQPSVHKEDVPMTSIVAENLDTPWAITFLPDNSMLVTERAGRVRLIDANGTLVSDPVAAITHSQETGEGGLLGIVAHPKFASNNYVYLYYTYSDNGSNTLNRVVRMTYKNNRLSSEFVILDAIPGASNHNGGRIKFGPDGLLYIGTGDAGEPSQAQNTNSLAGKILRVTEAGQPAPGNPFSNAVYSYGHRNVQGLTWDEQNRLWATEHGRSGAASGFDELNLIESGKNYGWPDIEGDETRQGMVTPQRHSGSTMTWAPAGAAHANGAIFFGGLRGTALYKAVLSDGHISDFTEYFPGEYGRIREVLLGPDGMLYITTSNRDGRGTPKSGDDKVIRINPQKVQ